MKTPTTFTALFLLLLVFGCSKKDDVPPGEIVETQPAIIKENTVDVTPATGGYISALPARYDLDVTKRYPLLLFIPDGAKGGNGTSDLKLLYDQGVPLLLKQKTFPPKFEVNGKNYSFVVLAPQFKYHPNPPDITSFVSYAKKNFRIDSSRMYIVGIGSGGVAASDAAALDPSLFAAMVTMGGISIWPDLNVKAKKIADGRLPVWDFHNEQDSVIDVQAVKFFIDLINTYSPSIPPKFTRSSPFGYSNHDAWTKPTEPSYKDNAMNVYEWMLQYTR